MGKMLPDGLRRPAQMKRNGHIERRMPLASVSSSISSL
jgi:hypothetical protein